jgi:flagellar hook-associated protein 3 FlgL
MTATMNIERRRDARSQLAVQSVVDMRRQLDDLQRQLGTGQKSTSYAGLGLDRHFAVSLRAQLSGLDAYGSTMTLLSVQLDIAQTALGRMSELRADAKSALLQSAEVQSNGQSAAQQQARSLLDEFLEVLKAKAGDRYLFGGRAVDRPPVETTAHILDGDGMRAGLKQLIAERAQADLGASGLGRLEIAATGSTVTLNEDVAGSPFGFKLNAVTSEFTGATITGPAGAPPAIGVAFAANPNAGESVTFTLDLPDGSSQVIKLTATDQTPAPAGRFTIGADPNATAVNFAAAVTTAVSDAADTSLAAASALAAADDFFNIDVGNPPRRVDGPPFDTATALVAGTAADTVFWYTGEMATDAARSSATARVDTSVSVSYGVRANEQGVRWVVQNIAAFAATTFNPTDDATVARYGELTSRLAPALAVPAGTQKISDIAAELAGAQSTIAATQDRHRENGQVLSGLLDDVTGVPFEQVATEILALQTRLQASLRVTSTMYQLNLTNYI